MLPGAFLSIACIFYFSADLSCRMSLFFLRIALSLCEYSRETQFKPKDKVMRNSLVFAMVFLFSAAFSQENYGQWTHYKAVTVNTTSTGANVTGTVANFPLLVRLTSANADVFTQALTGGADVRFSDSTGTTHYKYEKERWNATTQVAE